MKIDEPKTPYAGRYNPAEDEEEIKKIEEEEEAEAQRSGIQRTPSKSKVRYLKMKEDDIPGLELGEPENPWVKPKDSPKQVVVADGYFPVGANGAEDEAVEEEEEDEEKHKRFAELRKKHYEMKSVKELLAFVFPAPF